MAKEQYIRTQEDTHTFDGLRYDMPSIESVAAEFSRVLRNSDTNIIAAVTAGQFASQKREALGLEDADDQDLGMYNKDELMVGTFLDAIAITAAEKTFYYIRETNRRHRYSPVTNTAIHKLVYENKRYQQRLHGLVAITRPYEHPQLRHSQLDYFHIANSTIISDRLRNRGEEDPSSSKTFSGILAEYKAVQGLRNNGYPYTRYSTVEEDTMHQNGMDIFVPVLVDGKFKNVGLQIKTSKDIEGGGKIVIVHGVSGPEIYIPEYPEDPFRIPVDQLSTISAHIEDLARSV